jgi:hypothetical protein
MTEDQLEKQRLHKKEIKKNITKRYEKTKNGFLMRMYRNMESRISGVQKQKFHLYEGKTLLERKEFYDWVLSNDEFHRLFGIYEQSGYDRKLAPSVDRIDSSLGYYLSNMEIVTHSVNSSRGASNPCKCKVSKEMCINIKKWKDENKYTIKEMSEMFNVSFQRIWQIINTKKEILFEL